jgi:IS1 family transposase
MWSDVGKKNVPRWLWRAIDHHTGKVLAYVCGQRQDQMFLQRFALLEPFGIMPYDTDHWRRTRVSSILTRITRASAARSTANGSIWRCEPGSSV